MGWPVPDSCSPDGTVRSAQRSPLTSPMAVERRPSGAADAWSVRRRPTPGRCPTPASSPSAAPTARARRPCSEPSWASLGSDRCSITRPRWSTSARLAARRPPVHRLPPPGALLSRWVHRRRVPRAPCYLEAVPLGESDGQRSATGRGSRRPPLTSRSGVACADRAAGGHRERRAYVAALVAEGARWLRAPTVGIGAQHRDLLRTVRDLGPGHAVVRCSAEPTTSRRWPLASWTCRRATGGVLAATATRCWSWVEAG